MTLPRPIREKQTDIVIIGGGPAGIGAAIAAGRCGADVLLVERAFCLGSSATLSLAAGLLTQFSGERRVIGGIAQEITDELIEMGEANRIITPMSVAPDIIVERVEVNPEIYKYLAEQKVIESGAKLLYNGLLTDVAVVGNRITSVLIDTKSEQWRISANVFIDATGDGDLAVLAGADFDKGDPKRGDMQPMTLYFQAGNADVAQIQAFWHSDARRELINRGNDEGILPTRYMALHTPNWTSDIIIGMTRVRADGTDPIALTKAQIETRAQVHRIWQFLKQHYPGFEDAYITATAPMIGIRETRRIVGDYTLTRTDVLEAVQFEDQIALGCYPIDIHHPNQPGIFFEALKSGEAYGIPYRCLLPKGIEQLLVAGRCISATHEALGSVRASMTCMAMGQAAGVAATHCIQNEDSPRSLDVQFVQNSLRKQKAILE
ncbi:MAG: FAD-dependent oxidoreductase [Chloroflexota bacterium]